MGGCNVIVWVGWGGWIMKELFGGAWRCVRGRVETPAPA